MMNETNFTEIHTKIVNHLNAGGLLQVTTYMHSTLYKAKHASYFSSDAKGVYVKSGKHTNQIVGTCGPLVSIRFGRNA